MEYTDNLLAAADLIAVLAHKGQKDKAGVDYINHPRTVASFVSSNKEKILAMLHDIVEDTELTIDDLYPIFGSEVCDALRLLTHNDKTPYFDYIRSIKTNSLATTVKLADIKHNSDISRIPNPGPKDYDRINKYEKARQILLEQSGKDVEEIITERTNNESSGHMTELEKLEKYLKENGFIFSKIADNDWDQIIVYNENGERQWDAVCNWGSYGHEYGLLEIMGSIVKAGGDSVEGWLTADDIIERIEGRNQNDLPI